MAFFAARMTCHSRLPLQRASSSYGFLCRFKHKSTSKPTSEKSRAATKPTGPENIAAFFATYPAFDYNPKADAMKECHRLYRFLGVEKIPKGHGLQRDKQEVDRRKEARRRIQDRFRIAFVQQFNRRYGKDGSDLKSWQALCRRVAIPVPETLEECQKAIRRTHVNLFDLGTLPKGEPITKFATEVALAGYTEETEKYVPRDHPFAGGLLKALLRHIRHPRPEWKVRGTQRPRKKPQRR